jgi:PASTA domain
MGGSDAKSGMQKRKRVAGNRPEEDEMRNNKSVALLALVVAGLLIAGQAVAAPVVDQRQNVLDETRAVVVGGSGPQIPAQVVRSGLAGLLAQVELPVACETPSTALVVRILDSGGASPGTNVLATQTVTGISDELEWKPVALPTQPFIPAETAFAIALSSPGLCVVFGGPFQADLYNRGDGWYQGPPEPPGVWAPAGLDLGFMTFVEQMCKVPSVLELSQEEAQTLIRTYGCGLGTVRRMYSKTVLRGRTISQEQAEGTMLPPQSPVDFTVSLGPPPCRVPPVRGRKLSAAKSAITKADCSVGRVKRVRSRKVKRGRIISQSPKAGARLPNQGKVNLVVSRGHAR